MAHGQGVADRGRRGRGRLGVPWFPALASSRPRLALRSSQSGWQHPPRASPSLDARPKTECLTGLGGRCRKTWCRMSSKSQAEPQAWHRLRSPRPCGFLPHPAPAASRCRPGVRLRVPESPAGPALPWSSPDRRRRRRRRPSVSTWPRRPRLIWVRAVGCDGRTGGRLHGSPGAQRRLAQKRETGGPAVWARPPLLWVALPAPPAPNDRAWNACWARHKPSLGALRHAG